MTTPACLARDHAACHFLGAGNHGYPCPCGCHATWSVACRWGGHEQCDAERCGCSCGHVLAAQKAQAA